MSAAVGVVVGRDRAVGAAATAPWLAGGLEEIADWVGTCGRRREEGSKSRVVDPIAGRNWKHVALVFALPKTSAICALPSCEETCTFVVAPSAS
jgi:hypothetical protein